MDILQGHTHGAYSVGQMAKLLDNNKSSDFTVRQHQPPPYNNLRTTITNCIVYVWNPTAHVYSRQPRACCCWLLVVAGCLVLVAVWVVVDPHAPAHHPSTRTADAYQQGTNPNFLFASSLRNERTERASSQCWLPSKTNRNENDLERTNPPTIEIYTYIRTIIRIWGSTLLWRKHTSARARRSSSSCPKRANTKEINK
jgi:hypothetical protein